jgi:hypothetical protein
MSVLGNAPEIPESPDGLYIIREYDWADGWIDVTGPLSKAAALLEWAKRTENGTRHTRYEEGMYYDIFPNGTRMLQTPESRGR